MNNLRQIQVASQNCNRFPYRKPKRQWSEPVAEPLPLPWKDMTLLAGIICKNGIVMAADSQQTHSDQKRMGVNKISLIEFANTHTLVAEAGAAAWSYKAVDRIRQRAEGVEVVSRYTITDVIEEAVRFVNSDMRQAYGTSRTTDEQWRDFILDDRCSFELLCAYYYEEKPHLFRVSLGVPSAQPSPIFYQASGIGRDLAEYLLAEYASPDMEPEFAASIAIYVTEKVNEVNLYCSGHSALGLLRLVHKNLTDDERLVQPRVLTPEEISELGTLIRDVEHETKTERDKILTDRLRERTRKMIEQAFNPKRPTEDSPLY